MERKLKHIQFRKLFSFYRGVENFRKVVYFFILIAKLVHFKFSFQFQSTFEKIFFSLTISHSFSKLPSINRNWSLKLSVAMINSFFKVPFIKHISREYLKFTSFMPIDKIAFVYCRVFDIYFYSKPMFTFVIKTAIVNLMGEKIKKPIVAHAFFAWLAEK